MIEFEQYVAAQGSALLRLAVLVTGNEADAHDVVQDALSRALPRWRAIVSAGDPHAYVRRMVVNGHVSSWRRFRRRETPTAEPPEQQAVDGVDHIAVARAVDRELWEACERLPKAQRIAVVLRYYEQLSYAEIAVLTEVAEATVRSRVHRGLATLRTLVTERSGSLG